MLSIEFEKKIFFRMGYEHVNADVKPTNYIHKKRQQKKKSQRESLSLRQFEPPFACFLSFFLGLQDFPFSSPNDAIRIAIAEIIFHKLIPVQLPAVICDLMLEDTPRMSVDKHVVMVQVGDLTRDVGVFIEQFGEFVGIVPDRISVWITDSSSRHVEYELC